MDVHRDIRPDDLTGFLAGECSAEEGAAIGRAIVRDPLLRAELVELAVAVSTLRDAAGFLSYEYDDGSRADGTGPGKATA